MPKILEVSKLHGILVNKISLEPAYVREMGHTHIEPEEESHNSTDGDSTGWEESHDMTIYKRIINSQ